MKKWHVQFVQDAAHLVVKLTPQIKRLVRASVDELRKDPYVGKPLIKDLDGYWTYRAARYRIIYRIRSDRRVIEVHHLGPRPNVYEAFRALIRLLPEEMKKAGPS